MKQSPLDTWVKRGRFRSVSYLAGALHTPHVSALPSDVTVLAVVVAVLLLQELNRERPGFNSWALGISLHCTNWEGTDLLLKTGSLLPDHGGKWAQGFAH